MTSVDRTAYPLLKPRPSGAELAEAWSPSPEEVGFANAITRGAGQLLGFLLMLKGFRRLGYFPMPEEVPETVVAYVRSRLGLSSDVHPVLPERSRYRYHAIIREHLEVEAFGKRARRFAAGAMERAALTMDDPADLVNVAIEELVKERFELPGFTTLDRLARHVRNVVNSGLFARVDERLVSNRGRERIDGLLEPGSRHRSDLNRLKAPPRSPTKKNLKELQERLLWLESFGDTRHLLEGILNQKVAHLAAQARVLDAAELKDFLPGKRRAMLVCLLDRAKVAVRDGLAEMLVKVVGRLHNSAKDELERLHLEKRSITEHLVEVLERILAGARTEGSDDARLGRLVREVVAEGGGPDTLLEACLSLSANRGGNYLPLLWTFYKGQRATLFRVARSLSFRPTTEDHSLVEALHFVLENDRLGRRGEFLSGELDLSFTSERWRSLVSGEKARQSAVNRRHLEACVFAHIASELKTGDLCIEGSEKYADYREQLLSWEECEPLVEQHCQELGLASTPEGFTGQLKVMLAETAEEVDRSYPENATVAITDAGEPVLKKAPKRQPSRSATALEAAIVERMPERSLTDVSCAVERTTSWSRHLGPLSGSEPKLANPRERYLLTAFCYGTNMGPVQTARHTRGLVSAHELGYANRRHVTIGKLEAAITDVVNAYSQLPLPRVWGTGETAAADGTKLEMRGDNLLSEYHIRYGGYGGIAYHHVSDTYVALFTHFIACGVWEAVYIIDGLLENASETQPKAIASDTQGQSITVFGLAYLLGIDLMPRIRNWKDLIFYKPDKHLFYDHIEPLFADAVDWKLIETHWRDLMKVVISIRAGKVLPSTLLVKLGNHSKKNRLYRAFREVGRAIRTEFLLRFLSNQNLRRQITAVTNKAESYNAFSKWLFFGGEGIISGDDPEEQTKKLKYNQLLADSVVLQNAVDVTDVLWTLAKEGYTIKREDLALLSPYLTGHIKRFGDYFIDLEAVAAPLDSGLPELED